MSQAVPFAASTQGKIANTSIASFFAMMAITGLKGESSDFDVLFIAVTSLVICGLIVAIATALEDYPKEALLMVCVVPFVAGPLLAWTHSAGGGEAWKAYLCASMALVFAFFVIKPPQWRWSD